jgi:DNA-directed RNA polymerase subunit RPC12/RpoP
MPFLPCILCGKKLDQRTDKNGKPYFTCDPCGTQFFVRRKQGMEKLVELIRELEKRGLAITQRAQSLYEIQAILSEIDGLKSEIEKLDAQIWFLFVDEDKVQARKSLKTRVQGLLMELEEMSKRTSQMK